MFRHARALTWVLWRRHRWGLSLIAGYWALLAIALRGRVALDLVAWAVPEADPRETAVAFAVVATIPFWMIFAYLLGVFAYGFETDLSGRESGFPGHMLTLPASTTALALWPMLLGGTCVALVWAGINWAVLRPADIAAPWLWPALTAAVMLTWTQALSWTPFPLPWLRAFLGAVLLPLPLVTLSVGLNVFGLSPLQMAGAMALCLPVGLVAGCRGVARARRGDVGQWTWAGDLGRWLTARGRRERRPFASAQAAQLWFEWRRHGINLPFMIALILPLMLTPLLLGPNDVLPVWRTLLPVLFLAPLLAGSAAATAGKQNTWVRDYYGLPAFTATRPLTTLQLVAAKFKMALVSTALGWAIVAAATIFMVLATYARADVQQWWQSLVAERGVLAGATTVGLALVLLVLLTWKRLVENQMMGLTGREWVIKGSIIGGVILYFGLGLVASWIYIYPAFRDGVVAALPGLVAVAVLVKLGLAAWAARTLVAWRLIAAPPILGLLALWIGAAAGIAALLAWLVPEEWIGWHYLAALVVLTLPLVRPSAAPLALAWNRHRS